MRRPGGMRRLAGGDRYLGSSSADRADRDLGGKPVDELIELDHLHDGHDHGQLGRYGRLLLVGILGRGHGIDAVVVRDEWRDDRRHERRGHRRRHEH